MISNHYKEVQNDDNKETDSNHHELGTNHISNGGNCTLFYCVDTGRKCQKPRLFGE